MKKSTTTLLIILAFIVGLMIGQKTEQTKKAYERKSITMVE
jgi:uncharacterized membrane protein YbjE (DUF340 family)